MRRLLSGRIPCTVLCTGGFHKPSLYHALMKAVLRVPVKDYRRARNLKILRRRAPFPTCQLLVRMNSQPSPCDGLPVSLTRLLTARPKALPRGRPNR